MPSSLNCPSCGAPTGSDATTCAYCGSRLATIACPSCLGSMFVGSQFCPHCGAKAVAAEGTGDAPLRCPGCAGEMPGVRIGTTTMHQCAQCGSAWLAPDVFAALCADKESRGQLAAAVGGAAGPATIAHPQRVRYVHCAVCNAIMNRVNFGHISGIIVDVCKAHGVWFERDELRGVLSFIERGGLEQARAHEEALRATQQASPTVATPSLGALGATPDAPSGFTLDFDTRHHGLADAALHALLDALFR
ncbi:MAG TPA: zinc ribbon domain-containing protein [Gemmatimonadaceae bacterium]